MFFSTYTDGIETGDGRLAIRLDEPEGGIPLLLLQRFRGTMDDWDPAFITAVARDRRVIRFDSAGVGRLNGTVPETIGGMAVIAADVVAALEWSRVDVLGRSFDHRGLKSRIRRGRSAATSKRASGDDEARE